MTVESSSSSGGRANSKRVIVAAVVFIVVAAALLGAYALLGGGDLLADVFGGGSDEPGTETPSSPATPSTPGSVSEPEKPAETPASEEPTESVASGEEASEESAGGTSIGSAATGFRLPTDDQASRMYWEQVASQEQIVKLVAGKMKSVAFGSVSQSSDTATIPLTVTYTDRTTLSGTMVLRRYGSAWYFSSIARSGNPLTVTVGRSADLRVVRTIVNEQAKNQDLIGGIVGGAYTNCSVDGVIYGSGTATVRITLSGAAGSPVAGRIRCITKTIDGKKLWFLTSFAKN